MLARSAFQHPMDTSQRPLPYRLLSLLLAVALNDEVRLRLQQTVLDLGPSGRDAHFSYGLVNAYAAAPPAANTAPVVAITAPADGAAFESGATIELAGTADHAEDGDLTANLAWSSSLDGSLGTGGNRSVALSDGTHTITAMVADSGGLTGSASVTITVGSAPPPPGVATTVSVTSITYTTEARDRHLRVTAALADNLGNPMSGASVSVQVYRDGAAYASAAGGTATNGTVSFKFNNAPSGTYRTTVVDVVAAGLTWDGATPDNSFTK